MVYVIKSLFYDVCGQVARKDDKLIHQVDQDRGNLMHDSADCVLAQPLRISYRLREAACSEEPQGDADCLWDSQGSAPAGRTGNMWLQDLTNLFRENWYFSYK